MKNADGERRAFLRSLKPRIIEIQGLVAEQSERHASQAEIDEDVRAGIAEIRAGKPARKRPATLHEG
jgi:hypothetical protein